MNHIQDKYDVAIVGAGIAGACVARELSKYKLSVVIIEKEADVCFGATKGSHAIAHCGIPGNGTPLKNRGELEGNLLMEKLCSELDVPFKRIGKLLVAYDETEKSILHKIKEDAQKNGVKGVEIIEDKNRLKDMEPHISENVAAALYTPTTGVANPWSLVIGLIENAMQNGAHLLVNSEVTDIATEDGKGFILKTERGLVKASYVINAAGLFADKIARMVGDESFKISGSRQQRIILDKRCGNSVKHLVRKLSGQSPTGNFVLPTIDGNVMVGCKVDPGDDVEDSRTTTEGIKDWVIPSYQKLISGIPAAFSIRPFAGFIPIAGPDYYIQTAPEAEGFLNLVLGGSGFTAAPAMGKYVVEDRLEKMGLKLVRKDDFRPCRKEIPHFHDLTDDERRKLIERNPDYGHIVCRCEMVSEGEIIESISHGATTRDGIKFRTRAGMGRCQGNFCSHKVLNIMSRNINGDTRMTKKGTGSEEIYE
jgi:glycerol-3-phosphate dehydrogenase